MNSKKIAFIISVNNELYFEECNWYLNRLIIPKNIEIDIITVREAKSMTEAYNAAMESSDAKYKVYMHQDVFIINQNFILEMLNVFETDEKIGIMGLVGGVNLPKSGVIYDAWNCGRTITCDFSLAVDTCFYQRDPLAVVQALDGMLLATQYDIRWRDDILKQWHFYDVSQSFEFFKAGYLIVIPYQETPWTIHDCGFNDLLHYDDDRKVMFNAYPEFFKSKFDDNPFVYNYELQSLTKQLYIQIENLMNQHKYEETEKLLNSFKENGMVKNFPIVRRIFTISKMEEEILGGSILFKKGLSTEQLIERYTAIKFFLRRIEMEESTPLQDILDTIHECEISPVEIMIIIIHNLINRKTVFKLVAKAFRLGDEDKNAKIMEAMLDMLDEKNLGVTEKDEEYMSVRRIEAANWYKTKNYN